jgi:hypothetical protein
MAACTLFTEESESSEVRVQSILHSPGPLLPEIGPGNAAYSPGPVTAGRSPYCVLWWVHKEIQEDENKARPGNVDFASSIRKVPKTFVFGTDVAEGCGK